MNRTNAIHHPLPVTGFNVTAKVVLINPEQAQHMLNNLMPCQRHVRKHHVQRLATDMKLGRFRIGPDAILLVCGELANGQHRLLALIEANMTLPFLFMESDDHELYKVIDDGIKRTVGDSLVGLNHSNKLGAVARHVMVYERLEGNIGDNPAYGNGRNLGIGGCKLTQTELVDYCEEWAEELQDALNYVMPLYNKTGLVSCSVAGALHVVAVKAGLREQVEEFLMQLYQTGGDTVAGDLRNRLINMKSGRHRMTPGEVISHVFKAFSCHLRGLRPERLKVGPLEGLPRFAAITPERCEPSP